MRFVAWRAKSTRVAKAAQKRRPRFYAEAGGGIVASVGHAILFLKG
jgi:hypothetical protein